MAWVKLDDGFPNNPKVASVSLRARWLHLVAMCYCGRNLTDGALSSRAVRVVVAEADVPRKHVDELHHAGLWDRAADGYLIHDYLEYNPSRDKVLEDRDAAKRRMQRLRSGDGSGERSGEQTGERSLARSGVRSGTPSRPVVKDKTLGELGLFRPPLEARA